MRQQARSSHSQSETHQLNASQNKPVYTVRSAVPITAERTGQKRTTRRRRNHIALLGLAGPALLWYMIFMIGPLVSMFYLSTLSWNGLLDDRKYAGLTNFTRFFADPTLLIAVKNSLLQLGVDLPIMIPLAFLLGYFLSLRPKGHRLLSILFFTPALMSASACAMMFIGIYAPDGILNDLLRTVGLSGWTRLWIADNATALPAILAIDLWSGIGFTAVVFAARLSAISKELYEAADIDGASHWTKIWRIAFPMVREFVGVTAMLQFIWILGSAQNVLLITRGGPGTSSTTLGFLLYAEAFQAHHLGYSQAIGVVLFIVGLLGMLLIRQAFRPTY